MARSKYRGNLDLAQDLHLGVQVFSRTREETFPSLKKFSKVAPESDGVDAAKVVLDR